MKRFLTALLCAVLLLLPMHAALAAEPEPLAFGADGTFRILIVSDTQDTHRPQKAMLTLLNAALDAAEPDLVVFLGDQLHGPAIGGSEKNTKAAIDAIIEPVVRRGLRFALVFGNHDGEGGVSKELQMDYYRSFPGCLAAEGEELTGCGNYMLPLLGADGTAKANLWFFDSNAYPQSGEGKYDRVHQDQLDWYLRASEQARAANGGAPVAGYAFQHIIVPEIYDALEEVPVSQKNDPGVVEGFGAHSGRYYRLGEAFPVGTLGEGPCPPDVNGGEFDAWQQGGDIVAAFFGHDHVNDFEGSYEGIDLINTAGTGFLIYGAGEAHGVRLVTLHEEAPEAYETQMLYYPELTDAPLPFGFSPTWGALIQRYVLLAAAVLAALGAGTAVTVKRIRKKKKAARA